MGWYRDEAERLLCPFYWALMSRHINFRPASYLEFISARFRFDDIVNLLLQREGRWLSSATMYVCVPSSSKLCLSCFHVLLLVECSILHLTVLWHIFVLFLKPSPLELRLRNSSSRRENAPFLIIKLHQKQHDDFKWVDSLIKKLADDVSYFFNMPFLLKRTQEKRFDTSE